MTQPGPNPDGSNYIDALLEGASPAAAAVALAGLVNRASARLHTLARGQANAYKGQAEWPAWAQLQNAARALVLQASTCRDLTARLPADSDAEAASESETAVPKRAADAEPAASEPPPQPTAGPAATEPPRQPTAGPAASEPPRPPTAEPAASEPPPQATSGPEDLPPA